MDFRLPQGLQILERTPAAFRALLERLPDDWTTPNEGEGTFSAIDNLGHVIHGERTDWIPRARLILEQGPSVAFEPFDRLGHRHESQGKSVTQLLDELDQLRRANLRILRDWRLTDRELALEGEHPAFGRVTLRQLLATWVVHDLGHLAQTSRVLARQYRDAVGPWREYLPVLGR
jgi:hypothetical protein